MLPVHADEEMFRFNFSHAFKSYAINQVALVAPQLPAAVLTRNPRMRFARQRGDVCSVDG